MFQTTAGASKQYNKLEEDRMPGPNQSILQLEHSLPGVQPCESALRITISMVSKLQVTVFQATMKRCGSVKRNVGEVCNSAFAGL